MYLRKSVLGGAWRSLKSWEAGNDSLIFHPGQEVGGGGAGTELTNQMISETLPQQQK